MIIDAFIFYNELDLLDLRLNILKDVVDQFVILECDYTFSNKAKPLYFQENADRFSKFFNKITHDIFLSKKRENTRENVHDQRNHLYNVIVNNFDLDDNDIIILSDLDEIPNPEAIKKYKKEQIQDICALDARMSYFYLNSRVDYQWQAIKIFRARDLVKDLHSIRTSRPQVLENGGWHWSFLGNSESIHTKLGAFSHIELDTPEIHNKIDERKEQVQEPFGRNAKMWVEPIDESYPKYILENLDKYESLGWIKH